MRAADNIPARMPATNGSNNLLINLRGLIILQQQY